MLLVFNRLGGVNYSPHIALRSSPSFSANREYPRVGPQFTLSLDVVVVFKFAL